MPFTRRKTKNLHSPHRRIFVLKGEVRGLPVRPKIRVRISLGKLGKFENLGPLPDTGQLSLGKSA
jgi:hypothetical protein